MALTTPNSASPAEIAELTSILTALGATGAITSELVTIAAGDTLLTLNTSLQQVVTALNTAAVILLNAYPAGRTPFVVTSQSTANSLNDVSIPGVVGKFANITNITISVNAAVITPNSSFNAQLFSGNVSYIVLLPVGLINPINLTFSPPLQTAAIDTAITLVAGGLGTGIISNISASGYYSAS